MKTFSLMTIGSDRSDQVTRLRTEVYRQHFGDRADVSRLAWGENDERFVNLGLIYDADQALVSILRVAFLKTPLDFEKVLLFPFIGGIGHLANAEEVRFELPVLALGRAATRADFESQSLHGVLRLASLKLAQAAGAKAVVGTMEQGSPRLTQLKNLGYEFVENDKPWTGFLKNEKPALIGILNSGTKLNHAIEILEGRLSDRHDHAITNLIDSDSLVTRLHATKSFEA